MTESMKALMARQRAELGLDLIQMPDAIQKAPWMAQSPVRDPFWSNPSHHPSSGLTLGSGGGCRWIMVQMAFNWRLIGVLEHYEESNPDFGWCFSSPVALLLGAAAFEPEEQDEPLGWHKRAGEVRRAPERHRQPEYNRDRCIHGGYTDHARCPVDPFCREYNRMR